MAQAPSTVRPLAGRATVNLASTSPCNQVRDM